MAERVALVAAYDRAFEIYDDAYHAHWAANEACNEITNKMDALEKRIDAFMKGSS
jgi:hypothetical protein